MACLNPKNNFRAVDVIETKFAERIFKIASVFSGVQTVESYRISSILTVCRPSRTAK